MLAKDITSPPCVGVQTAARFLLEVGDGSSFPTAGHLAAQAGLAPVTHRSRISIRGERSARSGNKHHKREFFPSGFAALRDRPDARGCDGGKKHNAAQIRMARRPGDVYTPCSRTRPRTEPGYPPPHDHRGRDTPTTRTVGVLTF